MNFKIEETTKGKPCILLNNHKYRHSRVLKTGEVSWRCLGRTCGAALKSDAQVTTVSVTNSRHTGDHPVTWRRLSSPAPAASPRPTSLVTTPNDTETPSINNSTDSANSPTFPLITTPIPPSHQTISPSLTQELQKENYKLKEKIDRLSSDMQCILDHSIENDARLLEFTTEIFASPRSKFPSDGSQPSSTTSQSIQCDMPPLPNYQPSSLQLSSPNCTNSDPTDNIITSLRTTIEVLEAEVNMLRLQTKHCQCHSNDGPWTLVTRKAVTTTTRNRFNPLQNHPHSVHIPTQNNRTTQNSKTPSPPIKQKKNIPPPSKPLPVESVVIRGDSHARNIAGITSRLLHWRVPVMGICKPGAKLQQAVTPCPQPPERGPRCDVLIAGTNDLAAGEHRNIYKNLEEKIQSWPRNTKLVIATLPHRHDLPGTHNINQETALVNAYIEELAARHEASVLDINRIPRRHFTRHGMHLRTPGKWQLARLLADTLYSLGSTPRTRPAAAAPAPRPSSQTCPTLATTDEPFCLPFETYAAAVKTALGPIKETANSFFSPRNSFLGNPILAPKPN